MRGRFAPGPTGYLHLGNVWTALLSWLQVRQQGGTWVLRLEDVDEQRSRAVFARSILRDITWLGLTWDEGPRIGGPYAPYIQQQRYGLYMRALQLLQRQGLLYPCYCNRARLQTLGAPHAGERHVYDGCCYKRFKKNMAPSGDKPPSRRVHVPPDTLVFADLQYGRQETALRRDGGDFVVRRADGLFTYALAAVVDDGAMAITHVVRGRDLLPVTAQQIWLLQVLGYDVPQYLHVPLLVDAGAHRLSKRQHGITVAALRDAGADPCQILSYLAWRGGLVREKRRYTLAELVQQSELSRLSGEDICVAAPEREICSLL